MKEQLSSSVIMWAVPFYLFMITLEVVVSALQKKANYNWPEMLSNMACGVVQQIGDAAVNLLLIPLYILVQQSFGLINFGESFAIFILFFIIKDFMYYWVHRAGHENSFLWGIHLVHHQPKFYNYSVGLRMPLFHHIVDIFPMMAAALLGFTIEVYVVVSVIWASLQILTHTNYIKNEIPLISKIFVTPSHHRVHHGRNDPYINKNYGGIFSLWDRMFGTYQKELIDNPVEYGVVESDYTLDPIESNLIYWRKLTKKAIDNKKFILLSSSLILIGSTFIIFSKQLSVIQTILPAIFLLIIFKYIFKLNRI